MYSSRQKDPEFNAAFLAADYDRCRDLLRQPSALAGNPTILSVWIDYMEEREPEAMTKLSCLQASGRDALEKDVLLGLLSYWTNDVPGAVSRVRRVLAQLGDSEDTLRYDALHCLGAGLCALGDTAEAYQCMLAQFASPDPNQRGRSHRELSWFYARTKRDLRGQAKHLFLALDEYESAPIIDAYGLATTTYAAAILARDTDLGADARKRVVSAHDKIPWAPSLTVYRYMLQYAFGWFALLEGDELSATRCFRKSYEFAPSTFGKIMALSAQATSLVAFKDVDRARDYLYEAHALSQRLDWTLLRVDERGVSLVLAYLFAVVDPTIAQQYMLQYRATMHFEKPGPHDFRLSAYTAYYAAMAWFELGEAELAQTLALEAWTLFDGAGMGWRAALCALLLTKTSGDRAWLDRAADLIQPWPRSWIAREAAQALATGANDLDPGEHP
jgi:hypothetical protein